MDPAKRARVEAQVAEWLRYGDDLGLGPVYRDRAASVLSLTGATAASSRPAESPSMTDHTSYPKEDPDMSKARPSLENLVSPVESRTPAASAPSPAPSSLLPIIGASSLFEAVERIDNDSLTRIREDIGDCKRCKLHKGRTKIVFGVGNPKAELVFVGEGPGSARRAVRRPRGKAAHANDRSHVAQARRRLHRERREVPAPGEPTAGKG